ncbi:hypothetical protein [Spirosoma sp. KUDC1026]|uniref:hypothetical protein n=1 Tax=Spirosoma sp. KUDC1026 TaxID=2745947 RepID=UPI00159B9ABB|nr:hypothetical protein [Spirosoma sp. KUDC1026]QKZ14490.1 hypothetical protein HU175_18400 [Spirosoma sp. KUDC1026]
MHVNIVHFAKRLLSSAFAYVGVLICLAVSASGLPGPSSSPGEKPVLARIFGALNNPIDKKPAPTPFISPTLSSDPIRFTIRANKQSIRLGESVELSIRAELLNISPTLLFSLPGSNAYRLKLLLPDGFVQTSGDFQDYVGDLLTYPTNAVKTYRITGYFTKVTPGSTFRLLRSHSQADDQSLYVEKAAVRLDVVNKNDHKLANLSVGKEQSASGRSSVPTTVLQVIPETSTGAARMATPDYWGTLEFANCDVIGGWVVDLNAPRKSLFLDIYINGNKVTTILADQERQDVTDFYKIVGYNRYGFRWNLPAEYKNNKAVSVAVKITEAGIELTQSPKTIQPCDGSVSPAPEASTCDFTISTTPLTVSCGSSFTLRANCTGANCDKVTYTWSGNGLSQTGQSATATAPRSNTTLTYTVVASATGCTSKTATVNVTVNGCTTIVPPANADYRGYLDTASCALLTGWVLDLNAIKQSQSVDIYINGTKATTVAADRARPDVVKAFGLAGFDKYGFRWAIPDSYRKNAPLLISARPASTTKDLTDSPRQTEVCTSLNPTSPKPDSCAFTVSTTPLSVSCGTSFTLRASCVGGNCDRVTYRWTGNGIDKTGQSVTTTASSANGPVTYTVTATAPGCSSQQATATVTVSGCNGTTPKPDSCAFTLSTAPLSVSCGSSFSLRANCVGANCDRVTYRWTGNGVNQTGAILTSVAPKTTGTQTYTVTASAPGCASQTTTAAVSVTGCVPSNANYLGYLDVATCTTVAGWILDLNNMEQVIDLDIFVNGVKAATIPANQLRQDVAASYRIQNNMFGFNWTIPDSFKRTKGALIISVKIAGTSKELSNSPRTTPVCDAVVSKDSCDFSVSTAPATVNCGSPLVLSALCAGADCGRVAYTWASNGLTATGQSVSIVAPTSNTTVAYTITASAAGCAPKTATGTVSVTGCTTTTPPVPGVYRGFLDIADCDVVTGWIFNQNATQQSQQIDIYIDGQRAATITANITRPDVAAVYQTGSFNAYGYRWTIPSSYKTNKALRISVRPAGTSQELTNSPRTTPVCEGATVIPPTPEPPISGSCTFATTALPISVSCGSSFTLKANCTGSDCDKVTFTWVYNGSTKTGPTVSFIAPTGDGATTYTLTTTAAGFTPQITTGTVSVTGCPSAVIPSPNADYRSHVDYGNCELVSGWIVNVNEKQKSQYVDIYINGAKAATIQADGSRPDVALIYQTGSFNAFGFRWTVPSSYKTNATIKISVRPAGTTTELANSPLITPICAGVVNPQPDSCAWNVTTDGVINTATCGGSVTLKAACTGTNCSKLSYAWSGNGISRSGQTVTLNAPSSNGSYTYTVTASMAGCAIKTATVVVNVSGCANQTGDPYPILNSAWPDDKRPVLKNDRLRVAIDLGVGAVIREVTDLQVGENMINCMVKGDGKRDPGRDDQISLYALPSDSQHWTQNGKQVLDDIGYNPVQGGDVAGNFSPVLGYGRTDNMLYSKTRSLLWGLNNELGDYIVEQWIRLDNNIVRRHVRISGSRADQTKYDGTRQQELPCTYTNSAYYQYYVVQGEANTNAPWLNVNSMPNIAGPGKSLNQITNGSYNGPFNVNASEPWIAAIKPSIGRGIALHTPYSHEFKVGIFGEMGWGPAESSNAGYIANGMSLVMDPNGVYEFDINMVAGTIDEIKNTLKTLPQSETKPNYRFAGNATRHGFYYRNGYDQGYPISDELSITPTDRRFRIISPQKGYKASEFGVIYVRLRAQTSETQLVLDWRKVGQSELDAAVAGQQITFKITGDNQYRTIAIPVNLHSKWNGQINDFSIRYANPSETLTSGQQIGIKWISATNLGDQ